MLGGAGSPGCPLFSTGVSLFILRTWGRDVVLVLWLTLTQDDGEKYARESPDDVVNSYANKVFRSSETSG